jgi:hypothetical protein
VARRRAVDDNFLYIRCSTPPRIGRVRHDGSEPEVIVAEPTCTAKAVDVGYLYLECPSGIDRLPLSGGEQVRIRSTNGVSWLSVRNGTLYFTEYDSGRFEHSLYAMPSDGASEPVLVGTDIQTEGSIAGVAAGEEYFYWAEPDGVYRARLPEWN